MIYFRTEISNTIGFGHLNRCLILAQNIKIHEPVSFLVQKSNTLLQYHINKSDIPVYIIPDCKQYQDEIIHYPYKSKSIIIDLGHRENLENTDALLFYINALKQQKYQVIIFDGLDDDCFRDQRMEEITACIQPYWGTEYELKPHAKHWLHGAKYTLLSQNYKYAYQRRSHKHIQKILITFGGSDPQENTLPALIDLISLSTIKLRVIIGPLFSENLIANIEKMANNSPNLVELVHAPNCLVPHYQWADLGICGSGTTRYEASACGLPILFTSIYPEHENLSRIFATYNTSQYLGYYKSLSPEKWSEAVLNLQNTPDDYIGMLQSIEDMQQSEWGASALAKDLIEIVNDE